MPQRLPAPDKALRVIGFDDGPFAPSAVRVPVAGVVCRGTRFEGMIWGQADRDGFDATDVLSRLVSSSKYHSQAHVVLLDGIAVGGLNVVDLPSLAERLSLPCIAVMRRAPDIEGVKHVARRLPSPARRLALLDAAGPVHERPPFYFQVAGLDVDEAERALTVATDTGHVPEALRLAHMITSAVIDGESRGRA